MEKEGEDMNINRGGRKEGRAGRKKEAKGRKEEADAKGREQKRRRKIAPRPISSPMV